jgi:PAS domain S-box-containing protein
MLKPPIPANEDRRLAALDSYAVLDTHAEAAFDALTRAAAALCDTPIAAISLVDRDRQWFKSAVGLEVAETPREVSFCAHAMLREGVFEVRDAWRDPRFSDNPLVSGAPNIRFYAGAPLTTEAELPLGALCVIDRKPRRLSKKQRAILAELSSVAMHLLDHRKAEIEASARLRDANRFLEMGERIAHTGCYRFDGVTKEAHWSDGLARIFGLDKEEKTLSYAEAMNFFHPDDRPAVVARGQRTRKTGERSSGEVRFFRRDGVQRELQTWVEPWRSADGSVGTFGVVQDITERKNAEREAERNRNRYSALFDLVGDGIMITEPGTGRALEANEAACRMFGYSKPELLKCDIGQLSSGIPPYTLESALQGQSKRALGETQSFEWQFKARDGALFWGEVSVRNILFGNSPVVLAALRDITERKNAERDRNRFSALFDLVDDGILISDPATGRYMEANAAACRMFGYSRSELLKCNIGDLSSGAPPYTLEAALQRNREWPEGESRVFEWQNKTKDGALFWSEISLRYARFGDVPAVLAMVHDISHRKLTEQELINLKERAERANQAKSMFLATMSHEIRTPMNGVLGMNALLLETDLTPQQTRMAETVRDSAQALLLLLDDILDVAKLEAGQVALEDSAFDLKTLVGQIVELFAPKAAEKGLGLSASLDVTAHGAFQGAPRHLRQILLNLVANAVKFTERGEVTVAISAAPGKGNRVQLRFEVRDTGIGVSAEAKSRLFAPFEQADPSIARRFGGTGLGLSISRKLVELMGGAIAMRDRPGGGSVFWFEISLRRAEPLEADASATESSVLTGPAETKAGRILLAEDDAVNIEVATLTLTAAGYQVEAARNGAEAVAAARRSDFDLILMDIRMPGIDGLAATRQIRALPAPRGRAPILALTADAQADKRQSCLDAGMDDFVTKPFVPSQLREAVALWMDRAPRKASGRPAPVDEEPLIDEEVVDELRSVMSEDQFAALVKMFVARAEAQAEFSARWLAATPLDEIADEAHKLVSASGALGARRAQRIAGRLESACRQGHRVSARGLIQELARGLAEASAELRRGLRCVEASVDAA